MDLDNTVKSMDCGQKISNALKTSSFFTYKPDTPNRFASGGGGYVSTEEIMAHARLGHFRDQDCFMLQTLSEMGYATASDVLARVRWLSAHGTNRRFVPILTDVDMDAYLRMLSKRGVVFYYLYKVSYGATPKRIFFVTKEGFLLFSTELMRGGRYDDRLSYRPIYDIFRYVATIRVMSAFMASPRCDELSYFSPYELKRGTKSFRTILYGKGVLRDDRFEHTYLFEPVHFSVPANKMTTEEITERIRSRLALLKEVVLDHSKNSNANQLTFIVFIVEDTGGMRQLLNLLKEDPDHNFWENTALITSDYAVCESFMGDFYNALFGIRYVGVNIAVEQKRPYVDMQLPSEWRRITTEK